MKKSEVPQEYNSALEMRKVMYALNDTGDFEKVNYGSSFEEFATLTVVNEIAALEKNCLEEVKQGISSPIKYFMYKNRMDVQMLCSAVRMFPFRVKRHLKMKHFIKLSDKVLKKYADVFFLELNELKDFKYE